MIKVEHKSEPGLELFAFEASKEEDLKVLDLLYVALNSTVDPNRRIGYFNSKRLVMRVKTGEPD